MEQASSGFVSYQFDADNHHDAPDTCAAAGADWSLQLDNRTDGMIVPPDDLADVFVLDIPATAVGTRLDLRLIEGPGGADLDLGAFAPQCDGDVFAAHNQPFPFPTPPAPAQDEQQASLGSEAEATFCLDSWTFIATGLDGIEAPGLIHAAWSDGSEGSIPVDFSNPQRGVYVSDGPAFTLTGAWINLPASWTGEFQLFEQPCGIVDGGAVYGDPARLFDDRISFTPIRAGPHLVRVTLADPKAPTPPTAITLTCHTCFSEVGELVQKVSYFLRADQAAQ